MGGYGRYVAQFVSFFECVNKGIPMGRRPELDLLLLPVMMRI